MNKCLKELRKRVVHAEAAASATALGWKRAGDMEGAARRLWVEPSEGGSEGKEVIGGPDYTESYCQWQKATGHH